MASYNWDDITRRYQHDYALTGISIKQWCAEHDINYASARRYLKSDAQLPAESQTFYVATPNELNTPIKPAKKQPKSADKTNAQSAQNSGSAQSAQSAQCANQPQRDERGHFLKGNQVAVGAAGNPHPPNLFKPGNRYSRKHGGYSKFFPAGKFDEARELRLRDELILARTQLISMIEATQRIEVDIIETKDPEVKADLYRSMIKIQEQVDQRIARIESITRTLSSIEVNKVTVPLRVSENQRVQAIAKKTTIETRILEREEGGDNTPLGDIIDEIQSMDSGLMSGQTD